MVRFISHFLGPILEICQIMSWLQSGHPVINFFHQVGVFQYLKDSSQDTAHNIEKVLNVLDQI